MEEKTTNERREKTFENLKKFFESDMRVKETLLRLAPTEKDDFNEESRVKYTDKLYKELRDLEAEFTNIVQRFELSANINEMIKSYFAKKREALLISNYEEGIIQKIYRKQFSDMSKELIEEVKQECVGYNMLGGNLTKLINKSRTINELLHVMHSYITNNEEILQQIPIIDTKKNNEDYPITLYGEETELSKKLFKEMPLELKCGYTDIISMENKILMMVRDRGHALTIDINTIKEDNILVKYFIPKLCNRSMIESLPGINKSGITDNGANGVFETTKEEMSGAIVDFIEKVPTDADICREVENNNGNEEKEETNYIFSEDDAKNLSIEKGENGRRINLLIKIKNKLKDAINNRKNKIIQKDENEGELYDR